MTERRTTTPADVPTHLIDFAERTLNDAATNNPDTELTLREAIRIMLAAVLPAYELKLGAELARHAIPCRTHKPPATAPGCVPCNRYTVLLGARRIVEGRDVDADLFPRRAHQDASDDAGG